MKSHTHHVPDFGVCYTTHEPFFYTVIPEISMGSNLFDKIIGWFESDAPWFRSQTDFYDQYEVGFSPDDLPDVLQQFLTAGNLKILHNAMETMCNGSFYDFMTVSAHLLKPGQGIGIHTDRQVGAGETHRLLIQLNKDWNDDCGGYLIFFNSNDTQDVHRILKPIHASGVVFECTDSSFHAVSDVSKGKRFTLVFSFWEISNSDPKNFLEEVVIDNPNRLFFSKNTPPSRALSAIEFLLLPLQTNFVQHSDRNLFDHLYSTYNILKKWKMDKTVQLAGLYHSIYGTEGFQNQTIHNSKRAEISDIIGSTAEKIVYAYCSKYNSDLLLNMESTPEVFLMRDRFTGQVYEYDIDMFSNILAIESANLIELSEYSAEKLSESDRHFLKLAEKYLPSPAIESLKAREDL